ncbi:MAG: DUF2780 domain-containing protein [Ignavibacteriae bacterium]|nr:DUF2780 domain-containing protein [Ignavibacteriota bacterium]
MRKLKSYLPILLISILLLNGCSSLNVGEGLMKMVKKQLGVSDTQALGGIGAILTLAKDKLVKGDFDKLAKIIPGIDSYLNIAKLVGKISGPMNSLEDVKPAFKNLGMDEKMVGDFVPAISSYASMAGGSDATKILESVLK